MHSLFLEAISSNDFLMTFNEGMAIPLTLTLLMGILIETQILSHRSYTRRDTHHRYLVTDPIHREIHITDA